MPVAVEKPLATELKISKKSARLKRSVQTNENKGNENTECKASKLESNVHDYINYAKIITQKYQNIKRHKNSIPFFFKLILKDKKIQI